MDAPQKKFTFFLEDRTIELISNDELYFSNHPYYAGVSLASHQQVFFNFGQHEFVYRAQMERIDFWSFCSYLSEFRVYSQYQSLIVDCKLDQSIVQINSSILSSKGIEFHRPPVQQRADSSSGEHCLNSGKFWPEKSIILRNFSKFKVEINQPSRQISNPENQDRLPAQVGNMCLHT